MRDLTLKRQQLELRTQQLQATMEQISRRYAELGVQSARARARREGLRAERARLRADLDARRADLVTAGGVAAAAIIEAAFNVTGCSLEDLWVDYFALGGDSPRSRLAELLFGKAPLRRGDHDRIVQALNERMADSGMGRPLAYWDGSRFGS